MTGVAGKSAARLFVFGEKYECDNWYRRFDGLCIRRIHHGRGQYEAHHQVGSD